MKKLKRIVVGIDVFARSNRILKRALMLAKENNAELFIIQAIEMPWFSVPDYFGSKKVAANTKAIKRKIEKKVEKLNSDMKVPYTVFVKEGKPSEIILYESKLLKADMIIMGAHTKSKSIKNILGTTAQKVAHQSHLPVLIVKNIAKDTYKNILAPTDFEMQSRQSVLFVKEVCPSATIKAVNAYEAFYVTGIYTAGSYTLEGIDIEEYDKAAKAAAENSLKEFMKDLSIKKGKVIDNELNSRDTLLKYINKGSYDLVVIGSRGTSGVNALLGSVALSLLKDSPTDILVYVPR